MDEYQEEPIQINYFLFINSRSGDKEGMKFKRICSHPIRYIFPTGFTALLKSYDLFEGSATQQGFSLVKKLSEEGNNVRVVICGGDGTIPWVLSKCKSHQIDFQKIAIGILPIGTGNDFSRSLGWGSSETVFQIKQLDNLHDLVQKWTNCKLGYYDVWDICIETYEGGCFFEIKDQKEVAMRREKIIKTFTNYFGIGLDARVVYTVEQNRGYNAIWNKIIYTAVGARNYFRQMLTLTEVMESFQQTEQNPVIRDSHEQILDNFEEGVMINTPEGEVMSGTSKKQINLKQGLKGLVCLNCTSYMSGLRQVWETNKVNSSRLVVINQHQKYDDGNLQFIAFANEISLALERVKRCGYKVAQGPGPFELRFKKNELDPDTFMQVDGESVKVRHLKRISVERSVHYPNGRIRVMVNPQAS